MITVLLASGKWYAVAERAGRFGKPTGGLPGVLTAENGAHVPHLL
jgi:hypothetical protein